MAQAAQYLSVPQPQDLPTIQAGIYVFKPDTVQRDREAMARQSFATALTFPSTFLEWRVPSAGVHRVLA